MKGKTSAGSVSSASMWCGAVILLAALCALAACSPVVGGSPAQQTSSSSASASSSVSANSSASSSASVAASASASQSASSSSSASASSSIAGSTSNTASTQAGDPASTSSVNQSSAAADSQGGVKPAQEEPAPNANHVVTNDFEFDIPAYWQGKVEWNIDTNQYGKSKVTIYPVTASLGAMPDYPLAVVEAVPSGSPEASNAGDMETRIAYKKEGTDTTVVVRSTNWYTHYVMFFFNNRSYGGSSQEWELIDALVDLSTGGIGCPNPRDAASNASNPGAAIGSYQNADITFIENELAPSIVLKEGASAAPAEPAAPATPVEPAAEPAAAEQPASETLPAGDYSLVAQTGGYRGSISVSGDGTATLTYAYAMRPETDSTVYSVESTGSPSPSGGLLYSLVPISGSGTAMTAYYDGAQDALIVDGATYVRV